jgi:hypothetical protein
MFIEDDNIGGDEPEGEIDPSIPEDDPRTWLWMRLLGRPPPPREDESLAPPIDEKARQEIQAYVDGRCEREVARRILELAIRFESWATWICDAAADSYRGRRTRRRLYDEPGGPN